MYYVYELVNLLGGVDYVGHSENPTWRFIQHTQRKPNSRGIGKFYGRQDLSVHIVSAHTTRTEARREEMKLQKFWGFETEVEKIARSQTGENHARVKLTNEQVREIKKLLDQKIKQKVLANLFNVSVTTISYIKTEKAWLHIKQTLES